MPAPVSLRIAVGGIVFHVKRHDPAPLPAGVPGPMPVVLLHGFTGSTATWQELSLLLAKAGYCVIVVDLLGHGQSDAPIVPERYEMDCAVDDLVALLGTLGHERACWLGYSLGGRLALALALRHPERISALVLEGATAGISDTGERAARVRADEALAARIEREGVQSFVNVWEALPIWSSQETLSTEMRAQLHAQRLVNDETGLANSLRGMGAGAQPSLWQGLGELSAPVLLLVGSLDTKFTSIALEMAHALPDATMVPIEGAGHAAHLERPQPFATAVLRFLDQVRMAAGIPGACGAMRVR